MIRIVTDSSCDLPERMLEEYGITVVPLVVRFGVEEYLDGELSLDEFWQKCETTGPPSTSQPSAGAFEAAFERLVDAGHEVLCITITQRHSGTFDTARLAARRFGERVHVFDSASLSVGVGWQALLAARASQAGQSMAAIIERLRDVRDRMRVFIVLETLENLRRGGRDDAFIRVIERMARVLHVKPVINVVDGQLKLLGVTRSFTAGLRRAFSAVEACAPLEHLAVFSTRRHALAEEWAERLARGTGFPPEQVWVGETGAALASHGGAGLIGVLALPTADSAGC